MLPKKEEIRDKVVLVGLNSVSYTHLDVYKRQILMRSPGSRSAAFAQALAERDVPCSFEESGDFYQTPEISVTLALLEIVDNPRQDVPLIAVLRSLSLIHI